MSRDDLDNQGTDEVRMEYGFSTDKVGLGSSSHCPKAGHLWLTTKGDVNWQFTMPTTCKTWKCRGCRDRVLALVKLRIAYGVLMLGSCALITLTFRNTVGSSTRDAASVAKAWARFWRLMHKRNPASRKIAWFRVMEMTKRNQPHLHLVVGGLGTTNYGRVESEWRELWQEATGDSYIIDVREIWSAPGAAAYLAKYLLKAMYVRDELDKAGFKRRWSRSRNWPGDHIRTTGTELKVWKKRNTWVPEGKVSTPRAEEWAKSTEGSPLLVRLGDDLIMGLANKRERLAKRMQFETLLKGLVPL